VSELTLRLVQIGLLALLWIFVLVAVSVIRSDLFGVKQRRPAAAAAAKPARQPNQPRPPKPIKPPKPGKPGRGVPKSLAILEGPLAGHSIPLGGEPLIIGRAPDNSVVLQDDYVSSRHARFFAQDGRWYVEDLGSTNGTQVGGNRISNQVPLHVGTTVRLGKTVLEVRK
jgi:hypothetical protein